MSQVTGTAWRVVALLAIGSACPAAVLGQPRSVLVGSVSARVTHLPVVGAEVTIPALQRTTRASTTGDFELEALPAGAYEVVVHGAGYRPLTLRLTFSGRDTLVRDVELEADTTRKATVLPVVPVTAAGEPLREPKLAEFERHRAAGFGSFITPDEMEKQRSRRMHEILRALPGLELGHNPGMYFVLARRELDRTIDIGDKTAGSRYCYSQIYLDGIRIYAPSAGRSPIDNQQAVDIDKISTAEIAAVEWYAGPAQTPAQYNNTGSACGTLVLWTRVK